MTLGPPKPSNVVRNKAQLDKLYAITDEEIEEGRAWIAQAGWPPMLVKAFLRHLDADLVADGWCPNCNCRVKVRYPNYAGFVSVAKLVAEYRLQKPAQKRELTINARLIQSQAELEALSDEELLAIEEGEWEPTLLPPAA